MKPTFWMTAEETERELASRQIRGGDMALNRAEQEWPEGMAEMVPSCKDGVPGCTCATRRPLPKDYQMSSGHAAAWVRFQEALCNIGRDRKQYRYLLNSQDHRDAVHILGWGNEEELKYLMARWRMDYPALFERKQS